MQAQDSLAVVANETNSPYTEKDIKVDDSIISTQKFGPNFKQKYKSDDFVYEVKAPEKGLWERFKEWLAFWLKKTFSISDVETSISIVGIIIRVVSILIICYVIYLIAKLILNKEGQWIFGKSTTKKIIEHDDIERNLKYVDFEKLIKDTLNAGDKRLAIRYYYLWLLKKMSEKNIIDWNAEKTNSDYLYEIQGENLKKDFKYVSYLYNYIWYGEFELDDATFEKAKKSFEDTIKSIY